MNKNENKESGLSFRLLAMTPITLAIAAVISFGTASESWAEVVASACDCGVADPENGKSASDCCWKIISQIDDNGNETRTLKVYAAEGKSGVEMKDFSGSPRGELIKGSYYLPYGPSIGWARQGVTSVEFDGISKVGNYAFAGEILLRDADLSGVGQIGEYAFWFAESLVDVKISENVNSGTGVFQNTSVPNCSGSSPASCNACGDKYVKSGYGCVAADSCGSGYTPDNTTKRCVAFSESDCYASGKVPYQGACVDEYPFAKKHWTPAEAAQYLKETDNEIIMTFKVNR